MVKKLSLVALAALLLLLTGCLTTHSKEYHFKVKPDGSGEGSITFVNIVSQDDDERDVSFKDFGELVTDYLEGSSFEDANTNYKVTGKRLYEDNGHLNGEVTFTFASFDSIGFFRIANCACAPIMFSTGKLQENYAESNGDYLGDTQSIQLITWKSDTKEFTIKTNVLEDTSNTRGLLDLWKTWKEKGSKSKDDEH